MLCYTTIFRYKNKFSCNYGFDIPFSNVSVVNRYHKLGESKEVSIEKYEDPLLIELKEGQRAEKKCGFGERKNNWYDGAMWGSLMCSSAKMLRGCLRI